MRVIRLRPLDGGEERGLDEVLGTMRITRQMPRDPQQLRCGAVENRGEEARMTRGLVAAKQPVGWAEHVMAPMPWGLVVSHEVS